MWIVLNFLSSFKQKGACNKKPTLSPVDGGIGRRVGIINYPAKFIDEPDANKNIRRIQALLNAEMAGILWVPGNDGVKSSQCVHKVVEDVETQK